MALIVNGGFEEVVLDSVEERVAYVEGLRHVVLGEEALLEGQDVAQQFERASHAVDAAFLPSPEVGRDIVYGFEALFVGPGFDFEVETRIVDADDHVGMVLQDVALAEADVAQDGTQVHHHFDKAHDGEVADVAHGGASYGRHIVATPETELSLRVLFTEGPHEVGAVEVA